VPSNEEPGPLSGQELPDQAAAPPAAGHSGEPSALQAPAGATVQDLFASPPPAAIVAKPERCQRPRRTFGMTTVRRSVRLAKKPAMPAVQRAQRNLIRKLNCAQLKNCCRSSSACL